jgi:1-acyl-sn-glycerol-3-phosphate acyltransferase
MTSLAGERPSVFRAASQWAFAAATAPAWLTPAMAVAPLNVEASRRLLTKWARLQLDRLGIELHVENLSGLESPRAVLFVDLFQQTLLSTLVYPCVFPWLCRYIVNVEYAALPWVGWVTMVQGSVPIVRQRPSQAKRALERVVRQLRAGESFGISIEGQRTPDGTLSPYKKGAVVLAIEAQVDIVPLITHGEYALWPRGEWRIRPGRIDCVLYPPVTTRGLTYADRDRVVDQLYALAQRELRQRAG